MFTDLAVLARVAVRTGAVVLIRFRVHAGPSVFAGSVGAAVVQVCTQQVGIQKRTTVGVVTGFEQALASLLKYAVSGIDT